MIISFLALLIANIMKKTLGKEISQYLLVEIFIN